MRELFESPGFLAFVGTIFGASGLKFVEHWLGRAKEKALEHRNAREELRKDIESLRLQLKEAEEAENALRGEVDKWKAMYYDLRDEKQKAVTELTITLERLKMLELRLEKESEK